MVSTCKKWDERKIRPYMRLLLQGTRRPQHVGRKATIMPCKKCGGNKAESDAICDYCHEAQEEPNINQAEMLKLRNQGTPYPSPPKKYKQLIIKKVLDKT